MNKTSYTNLAKAWEFAEDVAFSQQDSILVEARKDAEQAGFPQGSATQARFLKLLVQLTGSSSIIVAGTGAVVESCELVSGLNGSGLLTEVDSSLQGSKLIKKIFNALDEVTDTTLRAVNAPAEIFLPRLNADDYDLIVVNGDIGNYEASLKEAPRLLKPQGLLIFTDMFGFSADNSNGGMLNPVDRSERTVRLRELLDSINHNESLDQTLLPIGTGLLIITLNQR
ncbi:O-methyltransferase [Bifidobacterium aquikefiri]|uniref:O-methyltransferase n=1 Tax=Bifidobacterium aquikefiri TaxID=1653207 RepID=UPI0039E9A6FB